MRWRRLAPFIGAALVACGISATGELEIGGGLDGGRASDVDGAPTDTDGAASGEDGGGVVDAGPDAFDATPACDSGLGDASVVVLAADGGACPAGTVEKIVHTQPAAIAGACTCGTCTPVTNPSCGGSGLQLEYGLSNSCSSGPLTYNVQNNTCTDFNEGTFTVTDYHGWTQRTPTAGSCTATAMTDVTKVTTTTVRECVPSNDEAVCAAQTTGARLCIEQAAGPCAAPFTEARTVGDAPSLACANCGCTRTSAKCNIEYHSNNTCTDLRWPTESNGVCTRTTNATNVRYFKIFASAPSCTATAGAPTAGLTNARVLCCTP